MLAGPLFSREALTVPRQLMHFLIRSGYVGAFFIIAFIGYKFQGKQIDKAEAKKK